MEVVGVHFYRTVQGHTVTKVILLSTRLKLLFEDVIKMAAGGSIISAFSNAIKISENSHHIRILCSE